MGQDTIRDVVIRLAIDISNAQKNVDSLTASTAKLAKSLSAAQVIRLAIDTSNAQKNVDSLTSSTDKLAKSLSAAQVIRLAIDTSNAQKNVDSLTASTDKLTKSLSAAQSSASIPIGAVGGVRATAAGSTASSAPAPIAANVVNETNRDKAKQKSDSDKKAADASDAVTASLLRLAPELLILKMSIDATFKAWQDASDIQIAGMREQSAQRRAVQERVIGLAANESQRMLTQAQQLPDITASGRYLGNVPKRAALESRLRGMESTFDRTAEQKAQFRQMEESVQAFSERNQEIDDELTQGSKKRRMLRDVVDSSPGNLKSIREQHEATRLELVGKQKALHANKNIFGFYNQHQAEEMDSTAMALKQNEKKLEEDIASELQRVNEAKKAGLDLSQRETELLSEQHQNIKKIQQEHVNAVRDEKQGLRNQNIRFGSLDEGTLERLKHLQNKTDAIAAQRKANVAAGRDPNAGVTRLEKHEIQLGLAHGIGGEEVENQAEEASRRAGLRGRQFNEETLAEKQAKLDEITKKTQGMEGAVVKDLGAADKDTKREARRVVESMEKVFATNKALIEIQRAIDDMAHSLNTSAVKRGTSVQPFLGG